MQNNGFKIEAPSAAMVYGIFALVAGFILPVLLILPIKLIGYSVVIEEISKFFVVLFLILMIPGFKARIWIGLGFGFLFGLSENFLYLNQIFQLGDFSVFWQRLALTVPMHIATVLIMVFSGMRKKWLLIFGFSGALILHYFFNLLSPAFLDQPFFGSTLLLI